MDRFENELRERDFEWNIYNSGDGTIYSSSAYKKDNIVCVINNKWTSPAELVDDTTPPSTEHTIVCADK